MLHTSWSTSFILQREWDSLSLNWFSSINTVFGTIFMFLLLYLQKQLLRYILFLLTCYTTILIYVDFVETDIEVALYRLGFISCASTFLFVASPLLSLVSISISLAIDSKFLLNYGKSLVTSSKIKTKICACRLKWFGRRALLLYHSHSSLWPSWLVVNGFFMESLLRMYLFR